MVDVEMLTTISKIYDAALRPDSWPDALTRLAQQSKARHAVLMVVDHLNPECHVSQTSLTFTKAQLDTYEVEGQEEEERYWKMLHSFEPQSVAIDTEIWPDRTFYNEIPVVRWGFVHADVYHRAIIRLNGGSAWTDGLVLMFSASRGPVVEAEREIISSFVPHVAKVIELNRPFRILERRFKAVLGVLDRFHLGVIVLSERGDLLVANRAARCALECREAMRVDGHGKVRCINPVLDGEFIRAVTDICGTAHGRNVIAEHKMVASRGPDREPLFIEVSPLTDPHDEVSDDTLGAIVFLIDPEHKTIVSTQGLRTLYGLTTAEAEVCRLVVDGHTTGDIADLRGVTTETVRTQIRALFGKTGVSRRAELVRLALSINLPIDEM